jgi:hypothetical protein
LSFDQKQDAAPDDRRWVTGDIHGLQIPADIESLLSGGADFLTRAFRAQHTLGADNCVRRIVEAGEFFGGGTGRKLVMTVEYDLPAESLPARLFVKFSRNFDNEVWDRGRFMMVSEANFAVLSSPKGFPAAVPHCLFADVDSASATGLIITACIAYGRDGVEPFYPKCMDYLVPAPLEHYKAILKGLARLSGAHRSGKLSPAFDTTFPYDRARASAVFSIRVPREKLAQRANKMFDFIERYPQLFPGNVGAPELRRQFLADIPAVLAAEERIRQILYGDSRFIAFAHWNANIDNCWFWHDARAQLQCGFVDWANAGQISVAQSVSGAISGAEPFVWNEHLDELLQAYIDEFAAHGGPQLSLEDMRLHNLLIVAVSGVAYAMGAPVALQRDIADLDAVGSYRDDCFRVHENSRIQLHVMTKMLNVWQTRRLGDVIRSL